MEMIKAAEITVLFLKMEWVNYFERRVIVRGGMATMMKQWQQWQWMIIGAKCMAVVAGRDGIFLKWWWWVSIDRDRKIMT